MVSFSYSDLLSSKIAICILDHRKSFSKASKQNTDGWMPVGHREKGKYSVL